MALDPNEIISQKESVKPDPNEPTRKIIVTTVTRRNGTVELWQRAATDTPDRGLKVSSYVDDDLRKQFEADRKAEADEAKATKADERATATEARLTRTEERQTAAQEAALAKQTAPTTLTAAATDKTSQYIVQQMPDGSVRQVLNPNYDPKAAARAMSQEELAAKIEDIKLRAMDRKITWDEADRERSLLVQDQTKAIQRETADLAKKKHDLDVQQEKRIAGGEAGRQSLGERTLDYNQQNAAMEAGNSRVRNYLDTMKYRAGPGFAQNFANSINTNGLNFSGADFAVDIPDLDAMADAAYQQAVARFQGGDATMAAPAPPPVPVAAPVAAAPVVPEIPPYVPPRRLMPV